MISNPARFVTLIALVVVIVLGVATWLTIPPGRFETRNSTTGRWETSRVDYPARLFRRGLVERVQDFSRSDVYRRVDLDALRTRVEVVYGALAAVIVLAGLAFGAARSSLHTV